MRPDFDLSATGSKGSASMLLALLALLLGPSTLGAQGFDSPLAPAGRLRVQVTGLLHSFDTRFGLRSGVGGTVEEEEPLGFDFTLGSLGPGAFPELEDDQAVLGAAVEDPEYRLNLGSIRLLMDAHSTRIPVRVDLGITDWLTLGGTVPFERRRVDSELRVSSAGSNVGQSPLITDPGAPSAFLSEYRAGLQSTTTAVEELCAASGEGSQDCADARDFLGGANQTFERLESAYGGSELFHLEGSPAAETLTRRVQEIQAAMSDLGVTSFVSPPPLATAPLAGEGQADFESRFIQPVYGDAGLPLRGGESLWELGDVELSAHLRLLNLESSDTLPGGRPGFRAQVAAGGVLRLGTAARDTLRDFLDLDAQRGTDDVELHLMGDLDWPSAHLGVRAQLVYGIQGSAQTRRRIAPPDDVFGTEAPRGVVSWNPGDYVAFALQPRLFLTPELALGASYTYYDREGARFSLLGLDGDADASEADASVLERETTATLHQVGVRLVFSTVGATRTGQTSLPFELEARWEKAVSGSGGRTPQGSRVSGGIRFYLDLWGGP